MQSLFTCDSTFSSYFLFLQVLNWSLRLPGTMYINKYKTLYFLHLTSNAVISVIQGPSNIKHPLRRICNYCLPLHTTVLFLFYVTHTSSLKELIEIDSSWAAALPSQAHKPAPLLYVCAVLHPPRCLCSPPEARVLRFPPACPPLWTGRKVFPDGLRKGMWHQQTLHITQKSQFWAEPPCWSIVFYSRQALMKFACEQTLCLLWSHLFLLLIFHLEP